MLRLDPFRLEIPHSLNEAFQLLESESKARVIAGGTDMLPNLKHGIYGNVPLLVSLNNISALKEIHDLGDSISLGAGIALSELSRHNLIQSNFASLSQAAGLVASLAIRNMGTLGGNICLDTRCRYINQTEFWRNALGGCLKKDGHVCHVIPKGKRCVAALSADTVAPLLSLDAKLEIQNQNESKILPLSEIYQADGVKHINLKHNEIITKVIISKRHSSLLGYQKWSVRKSVDFPLISFAIRIDTDNDSINQIRIVVSVLGSKAKEVQGLQNFYGKPLPSLPEEIAKKVQEQCKPLPNVYYDPEYRHHLLGVLVKRKIKELVL